MIIYHRIETQKCQKYPNILSKISKRGKALLNEKMIKDEMASTQVLSDTSIEQHGEPQVSELSAYDNEEFNAPSQKGLNLRPFLRTLQRKALLVTAITGTVAVGAWISTKRTPPSYQGSFRLLVEPATSEARIVDPTSITRGGGVPSRDVFALDYPTQLEILRSPKMLQAIVEQLKAIDPRFRDFNYAVLQKGLTVERLGKTELDQTKIIEVRYQGPDPKVIELVLKVVADKYLNYSLDERKSRINEGVKFIDEQLPSLRKRVDGLRSSQQKMQQAYRLSDTKAQGADLLIQLHQLESQQVDTQRQIQEQRTLYTSLQRQLQLNPGDALVASTLSENPRYQDLIRNLKEVEVQIATESARFQRESPAIQVLEDKQRNIQSLIEQEKQRVLGQKLAAGTGNNSPVMAFQTPTRLGLIKQLVETNNLIKMLEVRNQGITQSRNILTRQVQQFPAIARQYNEIQEQLDIANKTLDQLLSQRESLGVEAAQKQKPWELINNPQVPTDAHGIPIPDVEDSKKKLMAAVALGLALGIGTAFLIEKWRNIFYTTDDIKDATQLPMLGIIPLYKSTEDIIEPTAVEDAAVETEDSNYYDDEASPFLAAFDSLFASLRFLFSSQSIRSIAVCSSEPEDGKSTVALHLAQTAAAMGQRVLLVDANLRQPQLHTMLDLPNLKGLSDLLANKLAPNDTIQRSLVTDNLFVLTSGQTMPDSTRLLASAQMKSLMESFKATFDLVIYDTPYLLGPLDANFLAARTDGIMLIVAVNKTSPTSVKQALDKIRAFNLPTLGVVANHLRRGQRIPYGAMTGTILKTKRV